MNMNIVDILIFFYKSKSTTETSERLTIMSSSMLFTVVAEQGFVCLFTMVVNLLNLSISLWVTLLTLSKSLP